MEPNRLNFSEVLEKGPVLVDTCAIIGTLCQEVSEEDSFKTFLPFLSPNLGVYTCPRVVGEYLASQDLLKRYERLKIIATFLAAGGVLHFSEKQASTYFRNYQQIREFASRRGIHETDLELLSSATALISENMGVSILSMDFPLIQTWSDACKERVIDPQQVRFFVREYPDAFREAFVKN